MHSVERINKTPHFPAPQSLVYLSWLNTSSKELPFSLQVTLFPTSNFLFYHALSLTYVGVI